MAVITQCLRLYRDEAIGHDATARTISLLCDIPLGYALELVHSCGKQKSIVGNSSKMPRYPKV